MREYGMGVVFTFQGTKHHQLPSGVCGRLPAPVPTICEHFTYYLVPSGSHEYKILCEKRDETQYTDPIRHFLHGQALTSVVRITEQT